MFKFPPLLALAVSCVACGASFTSHDASGGSGSLGSAGDSSSGSFAGEVSLGAGDGNVRGSSAGQSSAAGAAGWSRNWGNGGRGNGGWGNWSGTGGESTAPDCTTLGQEYQAAIDKARTCDKGSTDQCSLSSIAQPLGCACPVLINSKSEAGAAALTAYQALLAAKCDTGAGLACDAFCGTPTAASCEQQSSGPGSSFVCTGLTSLQK